MEAIGGGFSAWKDFAVRKDILNTATGFIVGAALTSIINSLVKDIISPLINVLWRRAEYGGAFLVLLPGNSNSTTYLSVEEAALDGAITLNFGRFANEVLDFLIITFIVFLFFRCARGLQKKADELAADSVSSIKQRL